MKVCAKCKSKKLQIDFYKSAREKDGLQCNCKECDSAYKTFNKEKILARGRAYRAENAEKIKANGKAWRLINPDNGSKCSKAWRLANPIRAREQSKTWRLENPEAYRAIQANRRTRKKGNGGSHDADDIKSLMFLQRKKCACCGISIISKYHVDHIIPIAYGGSNDRFNLQLLCPPCNHSKNAKHPIDFMQSRGFLL